MAQHDLWDQFEPRDAAAWEAWLAQNHATAPGIWLVMGKRGSGCENLTWDEAVDGAIIWGWIDSVARRLDDRRSMILVTPRKPKSVWSAVNKRRIERLVAESRMQPPGLAKIEAAKADGSWTALDAAEALEMPEDLVAALEALPNARANYDAFPPRVRKNILAWVYSAKTGVTRRKRVEETARLAEENVRAK